MSIKLNSTSFNGRRCEHFFVRISITPIYNYVSVIIYIVAKRLNGSKCHLYLGPGQIVLDGPSSSTPERGTAAPLFQHVYCGQTVDRRSYW